MHTLFAVASHIFHETELDVSWAFGFISLRVYDIVHLVPSREFEESGIPCVYD